MTEQVPSDAMFSVGEIVIVAVATVDPAYVGQEREILALPAPFKQVNPLSGKKYGPGTYCLRGPDADYSQAYEWQLKRRPTPAQQTIEQREAEHA